MWRGFIKVVKKLLKYLILIIILLVLTLIIFLRVQNKESTNFNSPLTPVKIQKPVLGEIKKSLTFSTFIEAKDMIAVIALVEGKVLEYDIKVGDYVYKNQTIARIDSSILDQQVLQAQAAYNSYKKTFERIESLYKKNVSTEQSYDEAKAMLDASKAQLDLIKVKRSYSFVKAPISGTILSAPYSIGNIATSQNPLAMIANLESQIVNIEIDEKYYDIIHDNKNNLSIEITRPQSNEMVDASIISIDPYIKPKSKVFIIKAKLNGDLTYFRPGMYALAKITYKKINNIYILDQKIKKLDGSIYYYDEIDKRVHYLDKEEFINFDENDYYFSIPEKYKDYYFIIEGQNSINDGQKVKAYKIDREI